MEALASILSREKRFSQVQEHLTEEECTPCCLLLSRDGKVRVTLVGDDEQVKEFLENRGINYKVLSLTDAKFSLNSPISRLTEKQQEAISLAFRLGYFDTPRKIRVDELAAKLGLASSTLAVHLRRAERHLLAEMLNE